MQKKKGSWLDLGGISQRGEFRTQNIGLGQWFSLAKGSNLAISHPCQSVDIFGCLSQLRMMVLVLGR